VSALDHSRTATLFCRVSSTKQAQRYSPEAQQRLGEEYAKQHGLTITRTFQVVETASKTAKRTKWMEYLEHVRNGPEKHALVATVDRALRNYWDLPEVSDLYKRYGKTVHFFVEGLTLDGTHTSTNDLRLGISAAVAVWYSTELAEKTQRGMTQKALKGEWPTTAPFGYKNDKTTKRLTLDVAKAHWVRRIKELSAESRHTLDAIVDQLRAEGCTLYGHRLQRTLVDRVIRNPLYTGRYQWPVGKGEWVQGSHEPIVSWSLHEAAVAGLERKHRPRHRKHSFVFAGMIQCGSCAEERAIVFEVQKGRFIYGHCTGTRYTKVEGARVRVCPDAEFVPLKTIEEQAEAVLESISISEETAAFIVAELAKDAGAVQASAEAQAAVMKGQLTKLDARMTQAYADKLDGKIEEDFWSAQQKQWSTEKVRLEESVRRQTEAGPSAFMPTVRKMLELAKDIVPLYKSANVEQKRQLLNYVCSNWKLTGKNVEYQMKTPFAALAEGRLSSNWLPLKDSNLGPCP
jgi:site-specific DNA recombinase